MYVQQQKSMERFPFYGEPTPQEIHQLYAEGLSVGETYPGELGTLYEQNGWKPLFDSVGFVLDGSLQLATRGDILVGPLVVEDPGLAAASVLWVRKSRLSMSGAIG